MFVLSLKDPWYHIRFMTNNLDLFIKNEIKE